MSEVSFIRLLNRTLYQAQVAFSSTQEVQRYHLGNKTVELEAGRYLSVDNVAFGLELLLSRVGEQNKAPAGEGSTWFGVRTLQDPVDAAMLQQILWAQKIDLVIEIGTECGGGATFLATVMEMYNPHGVVLTFDVALPANRGCSASSALGSELWRRHVDQGRLVPRIEDVASPNGMSVVEAYVSNATRVMIIDDGDHTTTPLLLHFELLSRHVSNGSYYLIQDTRLDRDCLLQAERNRQHPGIAAWQYCDDINGPNGGPARAAQFLKLYSLSFAKHFELDRNPEAWLFTQHPGGWFRRTSVDWDLPPHPWSRQRVALERQTTVGPLRGRNRLQSAMQLMRATSKPQVLRLARKYRMAALQRRFNGFVESS